MIVNVGYTAAPSCAEIGVNKFGYSTSQTPLGTSNLFGCMAVVVHYPTLQVGCLGHLSPDVGVSGYFERCLNLMGLAGDNPSNANARDKVEIVFAGGNRLGTFLEEAPEALMAHGLSAINVYDARRKVEKGRNSIGEKITEAFGLVYAPGENAIYIGDSAIMGPNFGEDLSQIEVTGELAMDLAGDDGLEALGPAITTA